jgi:hypothetical protein
MRFSFASTVGLALLPLSLLLPLPGCGGRSQNGPGGLGGGGDDGSSSTTGGPTGASVGAAGGAAFSPDRRLELRVPANALTTDTVVQVQRWNVADSVVAYGVWPEGLKLAAPAVVTLHLDGLDLGGAPMKDVRIGTLVNDRWEALAGYSYDPSTQTITATTTKLGPFGATVDARVCLARSGHWACAGSGSGGSSSSGGSPGVNGADPASGASTPSCAPPTCAELNPCGDVPMATKTDCEIDPDGSYTATCCYDPGVPYCVTWGGGSSGGGDCTTAPPAPQCDTATCDPGATLTSCTNDTPNSFTATCCYPPGVLPDPSSSSSSGSGNNSGGSGSSSGGTASGGPGAGAGTGAGTGTGGGTCAGSSSSGGSSGG